MRTVTTHLYSSVFMTIVNETHWQPLNHRITDILERAAIMVHMPTHLVVWFQDISPQSNNKRRGFASSSPWLYTADWGSDVTVHPGMQLVQIACKRQTQKSVMYTLCHELGHIDHYNAFPASIGDQWTRRQKEQHAETFLAILGLKEPGQVVLPFRFGEDGRAIVTRKRA